MPHSPLSRDHDLTPEAITSTLRRQLQDDCAVGLVAPCSDAELDRVATLAVQDLWHRSRIKTFLPVLALRHARDAIRATTRA